MEKNQPAEIQAKYNLTFWQRIELIPLAILWAFSDPDKRKSWHLVKKGMEKHEHNFVKPYYHHRPGMYPRRIYGVFQCDHEGCTECEDITLIPNKS